MHSISFKTTKKKQVIDITDAVTDHLSKIKAGNGLVHLFVLHTTACLTTADLDPGTDLDMLDALDFMMPKLDYRHPHNPAHVGDHIWSSVIGPSLTVPFRNGELMLGTWQRIVLIELDGPRERDVVLSIIASV